MDLSRRELLVGMLQALLLALFPWLRATPRGLEVARAGAGQLAEQMFFRTGELRLSIGVIGFMFDLNGPHDAAAVRARLRCRAAR